MVSQKIHSVNVWRQRLKLIHLHILVDINIAFIFDDYIVFVFFCPIDFNKTPFST